MHWFWWVLTVAGILLVLFIGFIIYLFIVTKSANDNFKEECEKRTRGELPPFTNEDWGVILGAPYAAFNSDPCNEYSPEIALNHIKSSWGIKNRQDLIYQLFHLILGGHTLDYYKMRNDVLEMPADKFENLLENIQQSELSRSEKKELTWQYNMMYSNTNDIQTVEYLSWDYVRFSMLCLEGCRLKYITEEEAKSWALMLAPILREIYSGWEDLWNNFIITRWFWSAEDDNWTRSQSMYSSIVDILLQEKGSPATSIEWLAPLPPVNTISFAQAVASLKLKNDEGVVSEVEELNEIIKSHLNITET